MAIKRLTFAFIFGLALLRSISVQAQDTTSSDTTSQNSLNDVRLEDSLWASPRAQAMGGALSVFASDLDAPYYNPAGIGGIPWKKSKEPLIRNLYFPAAMASMNRNARQLNKDFSQQKGASDSTIGQALIDASEGKNQYARGNAMLGLTAGRIIFVPYLDQQGAAVAHGNDSGLIDGHFRLNSGMGVGASIADSQGRLYLGLFTHFTHSTIYRGTYDYVEMLDKNTRKEPLKETTYSYSTEGTNVGLLFRLPKNVRPSFGLVVRDFQGTSYHLTKKPQGAEAQSYEIPQDVSLGTGISPIIDDWIGINASFEADHLVSKDYTGMEKWRLGLETTLGGNDSGSPLNIRLGYNYAGLCYGFGLDLTMFKIEIASYPTNIGDINNRIIERRASALFIIDIADR